jgi:YD repeat-containing protein
MRRAACATSPTRLGKNLYAPDALDRITQLTDAINGTTGFAYDANSKLLTILNAILKHRTPWRQVETQHA